MKAKSSTKAKKSKKPNSNGIVTKRPAKPPQWKKVKLSGNLLSDDGGLGLEGLLGLEVLENPSETVRVTKERPIKLKKTATVVSNHGNSDDDEHDGSDGERSKCSKSQRKKKKKLLKKTKEKQAANGNEAKQNEPGRFVRPLPENNADANTKNRNSNKKSKAKKTKPSKPDSDAVNTDETALSIDDLIVRFVVRVE